MKSSVEKVTINIPVPDAAKAYGQLADLVECEALIEDGSRYVLVSIGDTRVAFVSGTEDLTHGRVALALQVGDAASVEQSAMSAGLTPTVADHPSRTRFNTIGLDGAADLLFYQKSR